MNYQTQDNGIVTWPTLYKTASTGKEVQWDIDVVPTAGMGGVQAATVRVRHGQVGGKIQDSSVFVEKGKNVGKANETTPLQQAISEADSKWSKQKDKGYSTARGGASMEYKPMLAHKFEDVRDPQFPAMIQPKLDGIRAIAVRQGQAVRLISRQGKEHKGLDHIRKALLAVMRDGDVWDGELYKHGMPFQKLVSLVKRDQPESLEVDYHVYDCVCDLAFETRSHMVAQALDPAGTETPGPQPDKCLVMVATLRVESKAGVEAYHGQFVERGYEGAMLRVGDCTYTQGYRSRQLLKVKAFEEAEFEIVDVNPGVGKMSDQAVFTCRTEHGRHFNVKPRGRDELRRDYLANKDKYVGKLLTVTYFSLTDGDNPVPRFPVGKAVREYE